MAITNPARLLAGYTQDWSKLSEHRKCYVGGCYQPSVVGRLSKDHGLVNSCSGHDPERFGRALGFGDALKAARLRQIQMMADWLDKSAAPEPPDVIGGNKVPRVPRPIVNPPAAGAARPF